MKQVFQGLWNNRSNRLLASLGLIKLAIHLLTSSNYGYFRDEFYYMAASKHLAFGYVDFPPFIALLTAFVRATLGDSLPALHFFPALAGSILVVLTGLMARELGAGHFGQGLAALATLLAPQFLGVNAILSMDSFDVLAWSVVAYLVILIIKYDRPKWWLWFGLAAGIGLTIKISMLYFGFALFTGLLLTSQRKQLRTKWFWIAGIIAVAFLLPYIVWNALNGFPTLEFWRNYGNKIIQVSPLGFIVQQILIIHPVILPIWIAGLIYLFSKKGEAYRLFGWAYVVLLIIFTIQNAKNYFLAPIYPVLFAAGMAGVEQSMLQGRLNWIKSRPYAACVIVLCLLVAPLAIPVLPVEAEAAYVRALGGTGVKSEKFDSGVLPQNFADRFGWQEMAAQTAAVYHSLPPADQANTCIFTDNYGEAGALEFYRAAYDLPPVISGHNNYFLWGPQNCSGKVMIFLSQISETELKTVFTDVQLAGTFTCQYCMSYENNLPIRIGRGARISLQQAWPGVKSFQ